MIVAVLGVISTGELNSDLRDAEKKKADGYVAFKIKVGIDTPRVDGERTRRLCQLLGGDALISSDANQGWSTQEAVHYGRAVADAGLDFFEQPDPVDPFRVVDVFVQTRQHVAHEGQRRRAHRHGADQLDVPRHTSDSNQTRQV